MNYRPEIDGLRAIAVVSVILYHAGFQFITGGFLGVDIFFVISGYLITSIIIEDIKNNKFKFSHFYTRRASRIMPAYLFVATLTLLPTWYLMLPDQFRLYAGSLFGNSVFLSNFYLMTQLEYFNPVSELQPLLHTWSLSIEEQYYFIFPLIMILFQKKYSRSVLYGMLIFIALSIYLVSLGITDDVAKNYFHSISRFWEIAAGGLCSFLENNKRNKNKTFLGDLGVILIILSFFVFKEDTIHPSLYTVIPVSGTMLALSNLSAQNGFGAILRSKTFVFIGLISYSAYLWHQPIFSLYSLWSTTPKESGANIALTFAVFVLSYITWRFIEVPFKIKWRLQAKNFNLFGVLSLAILGTIGLIGYTQNGFPKLSRFGTMLDQYEETLRPVVGLGRNCNGINETSCSTDSTPNVLVWGDSYAMHLIPGILLENDGIKLEQRTLDSCAPLTHFGFTPRTVPSSRAAMNHLNPCLEFNKETLNYIMGSETINTVVLSSRFDIISQDVRNENGTIIDKQDIPTNLTEALENIISQLHSRGIKVYIVSPTPQNGTDLGQCGVRAHRFSENLDNCNFVADGIVNNEIFTILSALEGDFNIINLKNILCPDNICSPIIDSKILYMDEGHLSLDGSLFLADHLTLIH